MPLRLQCNTRQPAIKSGLHGPQAHKISVQLGVHQTSLSELSVNPHRLLASLFILALPASPFPSSHPALLAHPQSSISLCSAEWSSRVAAPRGQDQICLHFFHPTLLEILCPELAEDGTWPLPLQMMVYTHTHTQNGLQGQLSFADVPSSLGMVEGGDISLSYSMLIFAAWAQLRHCYIHILTEGNRRHDNFFSKAPLSSSWNQHSVLFMTT